KSAHENKAKVHLDAAQALPHKEVNAKKLDVDFLSFSGHKMLGPSGMGGLYGKEELLKEMKPFLIGGDTVKDSNYNGYVLEDLPNKFEAGLQNYAGMLGMGAAAKYLMDVGVENIQDHEAKLTKEVNKEGVVQVGNKDTIGVFNFMISGIDHHEIAGILDSSRNIAIRSGMHCAHAWYNEHKIKGSARASFYLYNTVDEIKILNEELDKIKKLSS
ncbi:aminotransferase class V-fold PLP-dependent enzyme, partial [archaeon]|nr:aminotransferase class V-fold PLP-dependent enzyme [archaeon]